MEKQDEKILNRREFVKFMGGSGLMIKALAFSPIFSACANSLTNSAHAPFTAIAPNDLDELVLASGVHYSVLCTWGDKINNKGDTFGSHNDYTAFIPIKGKSNEALFWSNHEYLQPALLHGINNAKKKNREHIDQERYVVGGSIVKIKRKDSNSPWALDSNAPEAFRITGKTTIPFAGDIKILDSDSAEGMVGNCAGGVTPWGNILTCEENYDLFYGERNYKNGERSNSIYGWEKFYPNPPEHYGWVVEVNPFTKKAKKLTALGRMAHECATCAKSKNGKMVVYTGDDRNDEHLYKLICDRADSIESGELFVADVPNGKWLSLSYDKNPQLKEKFKDQLDVLIRVREASKMVGASKLDRPEDIQISPKGEVYINLTNNIPKLNFYGSILKIIEDNNDHASLTFKSEVFLTGGDSGFACPDNMKFDSQGNLWLCTDIAGQILNHAPYSKFKNNGLFYIPMKGEAAGSVYQIASAPKESELTGISFSPDHKAVFLAVQHPGEQSSATHFTSHWPNGGETMPKSAVIQLRGPLIEKLLGAKK